MNLRKKDNNSSSYESAKAERDNKRICILVCIVAAVGSLIAMKQSEDFMYFWALILMASIIAGIYLLSRLAELDDIVSNGGFQESKKSSPKETFEDEGFDEDYYDEESKRNFNINMPLFKKEAKEKYCSLVKEMGMTPDRVGNGVMDVWSNVDGIFGINKWEFFDKEISKFGGIYTDMIIEGNSGRCVDFCELRIPISDLEKLGINQYTVEEMVEYNDSLKEEMEGGTSGENRCRRSTDRKPKTDEQIKEIAKMINELVNAKNK